nr:CARDB domain-containing protein [Chitinophagaceae bacterium]
QYTAHNFSEAGLAFHWARTSGGIVTFTDSVANVNWASSGKDTLIFYTSNSYGNSTPYYFPVTIHSTLSSVTPNVTALGRNLTSSTKPIDSRYQWYKNGVALPNDTTSTLYAPLSGTYTVKFENKCGASLTSNAVIFSTNLQTQNIVWTPTANQLFALNKKVPLQATATSSLPVSFNVISGNGFLQNDTLVLTGLGSIILQANQSGNINYAAAIPAYDTLDITQGAQQITFNPIGSKILGEAPFVLNATSSSGLPIVYTILSGPATLTGSVITLTGAGTISVRASQNGNMNFAAAVPVDMTFCVGVRTLQTLTGPNLVCPNTYVYKTNFINNANYSWTATNGAIVVPMGDSAMISFNSAGNYTITVNANTACDTVHTNLLSLPVTVQTSIATGSFTALLPANGANGIDIPFALSWTPVQHANAYDVYLWPTNQTPSTTPFISNTTDFNLNVLGGLAPNTNYSWKVVAKGICSNTTSPIQTFGIINNGTLKPDLQMDSVSIPSVAIQNQSITLSWKVTNIGAISTGAQVWKDKIYLSYTNDLRSGNISALQPQIGEFDNLTYLLPGQSYIQTKTIPIPSGLSGTYYLFIITDNDDAVCTGSDCNIFWGPRGCHSYGIAESNEYNNYRYETVIINFGNLPDLKVSQIGLPTTAFSNDSIQVTYGIKNQGQLVAYGKSISPCPQRVWFDKIYMSPSPQFAYSNAIEIAAKKIGFYQQSEDSCGNDVLPYHDYIEVDSTVYRTFNVRVPHTISGTQYLHVFSDVNNDVFEGPYKSNNIASSDSIHVVLSPPADLQVTNVVTPTSKNSGTTFNVPYTVLNAGVNSPVLPMENNWVDSVFISTDTAFSYTNLLCVSAKNHSLSGLLNFNTTYTDSIPVQLPN